MKVLAIDLGLLCGAAWTSDGEALTSTTWRIGSKGDLPHARFASLRAYLRDAVDIMHPDLIAYEELRFAGGGPDALISWGGLRGVVLLAAAETGTRYLGVKPATWKLAAGLRSGTKAADALTAARARWPGHEFASADEAVARWIALAAWERVAEVSRG